MSNLSLDDLAIELHEFAVEQGAWSSLEDATEEQVDNFITARLMSIVSAAGDVAKHIQTTNSPEDISKGMSNILLRTLELYAGLVEQGYTQMSIDYLVEQTTGIKIGETSEWK